jgi:hypothetical protein
MMRASRERLLRQPAGALLALTCGGVLLACGHTEATLSPDASPLRLSELMSDNDGAAVDGLGETDDWIELHNTGRTTLELSAHLLRDASGASVRLPARQLAAGERVVLWADNDVEQGPLHLPFKLDADGERIELWTDRNQLIDRVELPALPVSESYARFPDGNGEFSVCRYATPGRDNGVSCGPPEPPELLDSVSFAPFAWPNDWPGIKGPLLVTELALRPAGFVEVKNIGEADLSLEGYTLRLAPSAPGLALPQPTEGFALVWPAASVASGERVLVPVPAEATAALEADPAFEGVLTLFDASGETIDRREFMHWPEGAALARPQDTGRPTLCAQTTPGEPTENCEPLNSREVGDRVRSLLTAGDFAALAAGGVEVGEQAVKFVVDMQAGDTVHLLGSTRWALHYTFVREMINHEPALDRCNAAQAATFQAGWVAFSDSEYGSPEGRRFLLGTLVRHAGGLHTVEFFPGDGISGEQMKRAFFAAMGRVEDPTQWFLRPADAAQVTKLSALQGSVPIVGPNAPFRGLTYQPLTQAVGIGELRFIRTEELEQTQLGPHVIVITDDVPNDIGLVAGLVTESFQTPLAHVNVLSESRGTPNMALRGAHTDPRFAPLLGKLVRLDVGPTEPSLRLATPEEADAFYREREPKGARIVPPIDPSLRGIVPLQQRGLADLPAVGAKAAQLAELYHARELRPYQGCPADTLPLRVPRDAFAIPVAHYLDHFAKSGARAKLEALLDDPDFRADSVAHEAGLAAVREAMLKYPVDRPLLAAVEAAVKQRFGDEHVRFRSSSNTEDLPDFNGAGLHTSAAVQMSDPDHGVQDGLRTVWASLWNTRAFDEREHAHIEQLGAAMGVLVHLAHQGEAAQGVGISRDLLDLTRMDVFYLNAQVGEASVTNPAPAVVTEQLLYTLPPRDPLVSYQSQSSLTGGARVLTPLQIQRIGCALGAVHEHFRPLLDPSGDNHLFAMQIEWKLMRDGSLVVKQARPQPFGSVELPADCREF